MQKKLSPALNHVAVAVTDMDAAFAYYRQLGLFPIVRSPHYARFIAPRNEATFSLHPADAAASSTVVYFEVDDLDHCLERLALEGIAAERGPTDQPWQWREAYLRDPDGNSICIYQAGKVRLNPPWRLSDSQYRHRLTEEEFAAWLDRYKAAWETADVEGAADLFADNAEYAEHPFTPPLRGRRAIRDYWTAALRTQRAIHFDYEIIGVHDSVGYCKWRARFVRHPGGAMTHLDGIFEVLFGAHGRCQTFREWWHGEQDSATATS